MAGPPVTCQKCKQAAPHQGDSWCLACCAHEALGKELSENWGTAGSRSIAADIIVSGLRQVRASRRLGLAGAGSGRASAGPHGISRPGAGTLRPAEPVGPPPGQNVKAELASEEESEEGEESSEEEGVPAATPKVLPRERSPIARQRSATGHRDREQGRDHRGDSQGRHKREEEDRTERKEKKGDRGEKRPREEREKDTKRDQKKRKRHHRGGSKHQRLYRANADPYRRFHHKRAEGYWDEHHASF